MNEGNRMGLAGKLRLALLSLCWQSVTLVLLFATIYPFLFMLVHRSIQGAYLLPLNGLTILQVLPLLYLLPRGSIVAGS